MAFTISIIVLQCLILIAVGIIIFYLLKNKKSNVHEEKRDGIEDINSKLQILDKLLEKSFFNLRQDIEREEKQINSMRESIFQSISKNQLEVIKTLSDNNDRTRDVLFNNNKAAIDNIKNELFTIKNDLKESLLSLEKSTSSSLESIRKDNSEKLLMIQNEVADKLDNTLSKTLKDNIDSVIKQLGTVEVSIGELKGIAKDVGDLKNVMTNVKTKGISGEVILRNIITQILSPNQYESEISTKAGTKDRVEFAIKMPGKSEGEFIYLPVDSKFPTTDYIEIQEGIDLGDKDKIEKARKKLKNSIKQFAKDIHDKYIDEPNTTSFAIMFLPIEGLYAEVISLNMIEELQNDYKVNVAGPTTFTALLNALQMGFKSLAIQKKSADIYELLINVRKEFSNFTAVLDDALKNINNAQEKLNSLRSTRTKKMLKHLDTIDDFEFDKEGIEDSRVEE